MCGGGGGSGSGSSAGPVISKPPVVPAPPPVGPVTVPGTNAAETAANYGIAQIGADTAYSAGARGNGVKVAVIDSGISVNHSEFAGRIDTANSIDILTGSRSTLDDKSGHGSHVAESSPPTPTARECAVWHPRPRSWRSGRICVTAVSAHPRLRLFRRRRGRRAELCPQPRRQYRQPQHRQEQPGQWRLSLGARGRGRSGALVVVAAGNTGDSEPLEPGG